jgi:hypothetical protein
MNEKGEREEMNQVNLRSPAKRKLKRDQINGGQMKLN